MAFRPKLVPTLFTIPALITLLALGSWQVQRLNWKLNLMHTIAAQVALPPVELPAHVDAVDDIQYRRVVVTGQFLHDKEIHLFTGQREFRGEVGYDILTPLQRLDGSIVLVDRGWVPADKKAQETREETLVTGSEISVLGMVHKGEHPGLFTPANDVAENLWFWLDMPAVQDYVGQPVENLYVRALKQEGDPALPIAGVATIEQRNDHLQYAITWYSLAIILVVIYVLYHLKQPQTITGVVVAPKTDTQHKDEEQAETPVQPAPKKRRASASKAKSKPSASQTSTPKKGKKAPAKRKPRKSNAEL